MNRDQIQMCETLIQKWKKSPIGIERDTIRKQLFQIIQPFMNKWISSILANRKSFMAAGEVQSQTWDCFEYCLNHFKPEKHIPIPNHFYTYTKFRLSLFTHREDAKTSSEISSEVSQAKEDDLFLVYAHLDELRVFRDILPAEYVSVFDDAVMSLAPYNSDRVQRLDKTKLSYTKYHEAKKVFKMIVEFLLMR